MTKTPAIDHKHDKIPLGHNTVPMPECKVSSALKDGKVIKVIDVPVLTCQSVWLRCQKEAEAWIGDCDGRMMVDHPELINARINAAYAWLFKIDRRFEWAGLAAFASKQVGCGLLHFNELIAKGKTGIQDSPKIIGGVIMPGVVLDRMTVEGADFMKQQIAVANRSLFLDIYPLHRFYMLRGIKGLRSCLGERQLIRDKVKWDDQVRKKLPFGLPFKEILAGFEAIERGDIEQSVRHLAVHEQINVLQPILYDQPAVRIALDTNQAMWVSGLPSGLYEEIQLTLSAQCKPKRTLTTALKRSLAVALWKPDDRMKFVYQAVGAFAKLLRGKERANVERSIEEIYLGHGIK